MDPRRDPRRAWAVLLLALCAVGLGFGLTLPTVTFQRVGAEPEVYSILTGVRSMWDDGNWIMAPIIFLFSAAFPATKLLLLAAILSGRGRPAWRTRVAGFLDRNGKWSMLDVFIVAAFVGSIRLGLIAHAVSHPGIHLFGATVLVSMLCCHLVVRMEAPPSGKPKLALTRGGVASRWISAGSAVALGAAWFVPLLDVRKAVLFRNEFALARSTGSLLTHGEVLLAGTIAVFVLAIPSLRALLLLRFRWLPGETARGARLALALGAWGMLEVFALGLLIVLVKLDELATAQGLAGLYLVVAAGLLAGIDGWLLARPATAEALSESGVQGPERP